MRSLLVLLFLFGIGLSATGTAHGQIRTEPWTTRHLQATPLQSESLNSLSLPAGNERSANAQTGPSYDRVVIGTTLGGVLGAAAGLAIVAVTRGEPEDASMFPWVDLAAGGLLGSTAGMYLGARLGSGGQGNPWLTGAAAVGGTALGVLTGLVVGDLVSQGASGKAPEIIGTAVGIAIPLGITSFAEWRTAR